MGLNLCWVGVPARDRTRLLDGFDLEPAGEASDELRADFSLAETPEGWIILVATARKYDLDQALVVASSSRGFAVGGEIVEGATFCRAVASRDGQRLWSVSYNEGVPGALDASGDIPEEFEPIKSRLAAEQAGAPDGVSYLFGAPIDLAAGLTGYRPGDSPGLEWTVLQKKKAVTSSARSHPRSLRSAMFSELVPLVRSLGWETLDRPILDDMGQIRRTIEGIEQTIWFDYGSGQETYIIVHFYARACVDQPEFAVGGHVTAPRIWLPIWKRFTWKRLIQLTRYQPPPEDIVSAVIDLARKEILIADEYLRGWAPSPCIFIELARPKAQWPGPLRE